MSLPTSDNTVNVTRLGSILSTLLAKIKTALSSKQDKLTSQTAYSAKGTATKVPQITTNSLGQVTGITEVTISGVTPASHTHGNIANGGTLTDTAAAAAGNDYVVIRDADNAKIQTSTIKGTDVADAVSKKHSHSTLTLSTTAQAYDGSHTLALPSTDPYTSARTPASHSHGNITNDGKVGTTADYAVVTTTGGAVTATSLATSSPSTSGNTLEFIDTVSQNSKGKISATKKKVTIDDTYSSTGTNPVSGKAIAAAIETLDVTEVGGDGKYIKKIKEDNGKITATVETMDTTPTDNSTKAVTSGGIKTALDSKVSKSGDTMTGKLTMQKAINQVIKGTGVAATSSTSGSTTTYYPAKWNFDLGEANPTAGDRMVIQIPVAGSDYGEYISTDNGTTYYPVARNQGTTRLTTHYPAKAYICVVFEAYESADGCGKVGSIYPVDGGTARVTTTNGCWRVINDYDSGNTYERLYTGGRFYAGETGCYPYSLIALDSTGRYSRFISSGSGTGTTKTINTTTKFAYPPNVMYYAANNTAAAGALVSSYTAYEAFPGLDLRYSCNYVAADFETWKPVFIECTINSDGTWTPTSNSITQTLTAGNFYVYLGESSSYSLYFQAVNMMYYYNGTRLVSVNSKMLSAKANDADVVHKTGEEVITGRKIFQESVALSQYDSGENGYNAKCLGDFSVTQDSYSNWPEEAKDGHHYREWEIAVPYSVSMGEIRVTLTAMGGVLQRTIRVDSCNTVVGIFSAGTNPDSLGGNNGYYTIADNDISSDFRISDLLWDSSLTGDYKFVIKIRSMHPERNVSIGSVIFEALGDTTHFEDVYIVSNDPQRVTGETYEVVRRGSVSSPDPSDGITIVETVSWLEIPKIQNCLGKDILVDGDIAQSSTNGNLSVLGTDVEVYSHPTQTAYTSKGTATKVPQITTDSTGHVTSISEVTISGVTPSSHASTATTYGIGTTSTYGHVKLATGDMNGATNTDGVAVSKNHTHSQYAPKASPALTGTPTAPTAADGTNTTQIATTAFVQSAVTQGLAVSDAMVYKGTITLGATSPGGLTVAADKGHTYKVVANGNTKEGYVDGVKVEAGDMVICNTDSTAAATSSNYSTIAAKWDFVQGNTDGVVVGPSSAVSGNVVVFDGATGKLVKDGGTLGTAAFKSVTDTYSSTGTDPVSGKAVAAAINALDVTEVGGDGKYIKKIKEDNGKITATVETMDTTPTANSTKAVTSGGIKTALDGKAASDHTHYKLVETASTTLLPNNAEGNNYKLYKASFSDFCWCMFLYEITEFFDGTIVNAGSENSTFFGDVSILRLGGYPDIKNAKVGAMISYNTSTVLSSDSEKIMPIIAKQDVTYVHTWSSATNQCIAIGDVGSNVAIDTPTTLSTSRYTIIECENYTSLYVNAGWYSGSWSSVKNTVGAVWAFIDANNTVISRSAATAYGSNEILTVPSNAKKFVCNCSGSSAAYAYVGIPAESSRYFLALDIRAGAGTATLFGRFYTRATATSSYSARPLLLTSLSNVGINSTSVPPVGWTEYRRGTHQTEAGTADKLTTARELAVLLSNTSTTTNFDGSADVTNIKVRGQLADANIASAATWNAKQNALTFDNSRPLTIGTTAAANTATGNGHFHDGIASVARASVTNIDLPNGGVDRARLTLSQVTQLTTGGIDPGDGYVLNFLWDNTGNWDTQIYVPNSKKADKDFGHLKVRYKNESSTWGDWEYLPGAFMGTLLTSTDDLDAIPAPQKGVTGEVIQYYWKYTSKPKSTSSIGQPGMDATTGLPSGTRSANLFVFEQSNNRTDARHLIQLMICADNGIWVRRQFTDVWNVWSKILTSSDITTDTSTKNGIITVAGTDKTVYVPPVYDAAFNRANNTASADQCWAKIAEMSFDITASYVISGTWRVYCANRYAQTGILEFHSFISASSTSATFGQVELKWIGTEPISFRNYNFCMVLKAKTEAGQPVVAELWCQCETSQRGISITEIGGNAWSAIRVTNDRRWVYFNPADSEKTTKPVASETIQVVDPIPETCTKSVYKEITLPKEQISYIKINSTQWHHQQMFVYSAESTSVHGEYIIRSFSTGNGNASFQVISLCGGQYTENVEWYTKANERYIKFDLSSVTSDRKYRFGLTELSGGRTSDFELVSELPSGVVQITPTGPSARKLDTARELSVDLSSTSTTATSFDGTQNVSIKNTGTLPISKGGTGKTSVTAGNYLVGNGTNALAEKTPNAAANDLINALPVGDSTPGGDDYYVSQYANGGTTTTTYYRRPIKLLWEYIKTRISSVLGLTATNYGGTAATATTSADASNELQVVGVQSSATSTLKRDSGVTVQGSAVKATTFKLGTNATITYNSTTEAIDFTFM